MKFLIFVTVLVGVFYAAKSKKSKGGTKKRLQAIKDELSELKEGQGVLGEKIQSLEKKLEKAETWRLGMNINPADGHIFGYTVGKK